MSIVILFAVVIIIVLMCRAALGPARDLPSVRTGARGETRAPRTREEDYFALRACGVREANNQGLLGFSGLGSLEHEHVSAERADRAEESELGESHERGARQACDRVVAAPAGAESYVPATSQVEADDPSTSHGFSHDTASDAADVSCDSDGGGWSDSDD